MKKTLLVVLFVFLGLASCSANRTGNLSVYLTDLPAQYKELWVTITQISLYGEDGKATNIDLTGTPVKVNLLDAAIDPVLVATDDVPAATYSQLRLLIVDNVSGPDYNNYIIVTETVDGQPVDNKYPVKIPSLEIKINYPISVQVGQTKITLDWNVEEGLHVADTGTDKYILRPVVSVTKVEFASSTN